MANPNRPNILWICTDQQRYDTVHGLNNPYIHTPHLDRLCAEGVAFTHAYCQNPICTPSRASFLTGLYPSAVHANRNGNAYFPANERVRLITKRLANTGYDCGLSGKLHIASAWTGVETRIDDGYRYFALSHGPHQAFRHGNQYMDWVEQQGVFDLVFKTSPLSNGWRPSAHDTASYSYQENIPARYHQTTWCADRAIDFITQPHPGPWLMSFNPLDPHIPFDAPLDYKNRYDPAQLPPPLFRESDLVVQQRLSTHWFAESPQRPTERHQHNKASYYGMIELIDENVGRLLDHLEKTGQRDNTLVIFTSDHGEMLGDHALTHKGCRFYEGAVRVPLIFSWPSRFVSAVRCDALVELNDLAPTLAELAGTPLEWTHGRSLLPILTGADPGLTPHPYVRCEYYDTVEVGAPDFPRTSPPAYATMYRDPRYKLVVYHGSDYGEFYDLKSDPDEFHNLWEEPASANLKAQLIKKSFDASIVIADPGPAIVGRY